jgi:nucleoside-diphosphate-sugar epimerase
MRQKHIALFGAKGFVGSEIHRMLVEKGDEVTAVHRDNFETILNDNKIYDYVINVAMPSARFKASQNPLWDFKETVEKTASIFYKTKFKKFVHVSSVSARCQLDTVYGRHKRAAESIVTTQSLAESDQHLIVRLGPMFGDTLSKGVLIDMLKRNPIFVSGESRYAFAPLDFVANWIAHHLDHVGVIEVGARNSISLKDLAHELNLQVQFQVNEDHQEMQTIDLNYPDVNLVLEYMHKKLKELQ